MLILLEMALQEETTCDKCGAACEHGWDAHVMLSPKSGTITLCQECWEKSS